MKKLAGRVAIVTGAGSGFGRAISAAFTAEGATVFGLGRRTSKLEETAKVAGPSFVPITWDVTKTAQASDIVDRVCRDGKGLHILVNNAAVVLDDELPISQLTVEDFEKTMQTNVTSIFALSRAAFPVMRKQRYGRVMNLTSGLSFRASLEFGSYCVSKAAVNMLTRVFALDGQPDNILVNAIDPGVARTEMNTWAEETPETVVPVAMHLASLQEGGASGLCFNKALAQVSWGSAS